MTKKLLVLALDAANPALLRQWAADGTLPHLARLMAGGLVGETRSVEGLFVGATWPSFYTGHHPGNHGLYWLDRLIPGTYRMQRARPQDFGRRPAIWDVLNRAGKRVIVLDVPLSRRSPGLNGVQVLEWGVHDAAFGFQTSPRALGRELLRRIGPHPTPTACDAPRRSLDQYRLFADQLIQGAKARSVLTRQLLSSQAWDFAIQVFSETHCAGHQLWHFHDAAHPGFEPQVQAEVGDLLRKVYVAVDAAIGEILSTLGDQVTVVVLALHGMSHACGASLALPEVLARLGATGDPADAASAAASSGRGSLAELPLRAYRRLPEAIRRPFYDWREHINQRWLGRGTAIGITPDRTKAFPISLGTGSPFSGVRLNLRGREPQGVLLAEEVEPFCRELAGHLAELVDPDSGRQVVKRVIRTADLYPGTYAGELPDLLIEWDVGTARGSTVVGSGAGAVWRVHSPRVGTIAIPNSYCRTGEHRIEGMFVATGPGIRNGRSSEVLSILDYAPTIAHFFGTEMPATDGRVIPEFPV